ncbi:LysM peptidoglycan-binding domain-containing protein [Aneurinibacillus sp. BA2021]|nr:LysM peptidoglycan-binding domain-containing protein [Aneurinibacillus sp. BA2021]
MLLLCIGLWNTPATAHATVSHVYTIQANETLYSIAVKHHTTVEQLLHYNPDIANKDTIRSGQSMTAT